VTLVPVILCGGPGSRLWPSSTPSHPKPFIDLLGGPSLFQRTAMRMAAIPGGAPPLVVTGAATAFEVRRQLDVLGIDAEILTEPMARDSGPAIVAAALWVARTTPHALMVVVASDHHIPDTEAFVAGVAAARAAAADGAIVTFGVRPRHAATAFGYIRTGKALTADSQVRRVTAFEEKPDAVRAERLVAEGCLWNSGNFMFRVDVLLVEARAHRPGLVEAVAVALPERVGPGGLAPLSAAFEAAPRVSIDVGVMELTSKAAVLPIDYAWSDLGSWDAIWRASARDSAGNAVSGAASLTEGRDCLVRAEGGARVVGIGLERIAVVVRGKDVLVADLGRAGELKSALEAFQRAEARLVDPVDPEAALAEAGTRLTHWLFAHALPTWWCFGADHEGGGFHESLTGDRRSTGEPRRARVQARQVYVYATAGSMGWPGPWRTAVGHGLAALQARFARPDGLYRSTVTCDGAPLDDTARLYDQAFILLALAGVVRAGMDDAPARRAQARGLATAVRDRFAHPTGGFRAETDRAMFLVDPLMHLFEASIVWAELDAAGPWTAMAAEILALFSDHLFDHRGGRIYEVYDEAWRPMNVPGEDRLEPGHQFEWAWLLDRWSRLAGDETAGALARRLYRTGKAGIDRRTGLVVDALDDDLRIARGTSRLWPQTEWLKAALALEPDAGSRAREALAAVAALNRYLGVEPAGLWVDAPGARAGEVVGISLASSFYHIVGALAELVAVGSGPGPGGQRSSRSPSEREPATLDR
jgi:mannose-1-phosphate guanylyltransferase/mannose-6-phosphate isomerase